MERATNTLHHVLEPIDQLKTFAFTTLWVGGCGQHFTFFAVENIDDLEVAYDFEFSASVELD